MANRAEKVRKKLLELDLDALFITNQQNVSYLTGFTALAANEREGFILITKNHLYFFVFSTYFDLFEKGKNEFTVLCLSYKKRLSGYLNKISQKEKIESIGIEEENITLSEFASLKNKVKVKWQKTKGLVEDLRVIKEEEELKSIKKAAKITDDAFSFIKGKIKKGVSEKELALELEYFLKKNAGEIAFSPIVAFNQNAAIPHYLPTNNQQLTNNDLILLDFGAKVNGYCADMTRVIFFGEPSFKHKLVYEIVLHTQEEIIKTLNHHSHNTYYYSGIKKKEMAISGAKLDKIARQFIKKHHFTPYLHGLGHGVGLSIHEDPRLKINSEHILLPGMVFTIEPGIYIKNWGGIRIEDLVVLKENGIEILSKSPKEFIII